jgi:hypothetical protein
MPQQRFEDYGLTGGIASEKAADRLKAQTSTAFEAQQQREDQKTTQDIEAEKVKPQKKQEKQQVVKPKRKGKTATRRRK